MIRVAWRALDVLALSTQLERGEVDLALAAPEHAPAVMRQRRLYDEDYAVIVRQEHLAVQGRLDLDVFCTHHHAALQPGMFESGLCQTPTSVFCKYIHHKSHRTKLRHNAFNYFLPKNSIIFELMSSMDVPIHATPEI